MYQRVRQFALLLLSFTLATSAYKITCGENTLIPIDIDSNQQEKADLNAKVTWRKIMTFFPYNVHEYQKKSSNNHLLRSYFLTRLKFQEVQGILVDYNETLMEGENKILYEVLPEVIAIESQPNEFLEFQLLSQELSNRKFVVKNGTWGRGEVRGSMDLNFYSLQVHTYLFRIIKRAYTILKSNSTQNKLLKEYYFQRYNISVNSSLLIESDFKKSFVVEKMLTSGKTYIKNEENYYYLIPKVMTRKITTRTHWKAFFDGFNFVFFSASLPLPAPQSSEEPTLQLVNVIHGVSEVKRLQVINQTLSYLSLQSVEFLDLCSVNSRTLVLVSDKRNGYLIDISSLQWHVIRYLKHQGTEFQSIFFNLECELVAIRSTSQSIEERGNNATYINKQLSNTKIEEHYPLKAHTMLQVPQKYNQSFYLGNDLLVVCWEDKQCDLYETKRFTEVLVTNWPRNFSSKSIVAPRLRTTLEENNKISQIQLVETEDNQTLSFEFKKEPILDNSSLVELRRIIYSSLVYFDDIKYVTSEMDRIIYQRLSQQSRSQGIAEQLLAEQQPVDSCFSEEPISLSQNRVIFNSSKPWDVCSVDRPTKRFLSLKISFPQALTSGYQVYLCSSYFQVTSNPTNIDCSALTEGFPGGLQKSDVYRALRANHYYRMYLVKKERMQGFNLPTFFIKDIQKQQVQIASTIFIFLMVFFCLVLVGIILFYLLKYVIYNLLVYYGYVHSRTEPTYPLGWFALEIRLKRLRQIGVLTFTRYEPSFNDTEGNHCCFCLQLLHYKTEVAQIYCGHEFHKTCFSDWMKNEPHAKCPTCRRPFTAEGLAEYQNGAGSNQQLPL